MTSMTDIFACPVQFLIGPNLLSSRTDARYLNIRKGVCPAFNNGSLR
jgi:hypothetical protein